MARRIMRTFKMNEISAVDRPAQVHARMTIMKRDTNALPDGVSKTAGNSGDNPDHVGEFNMDAKELQKMIDDAVKAATDPLQAELAKAFPPKKKPVDDGDEPDADDATKSAWRSYVAKQVEAAVAKTKEEAAADVAKAAEIAKGDELLVVDGKTLRKSEVGDASFSIMKGLYEDKEINAFSKRAETEIRMLPGEVVAKAKALRAISKLAKEDAETIEKMLKAGSEAMANVTKSLGHSIQSEGSAQQDIDKNVATLMAEKKISKAEALDQFMRTDAGKELYKRSIDKAAA